MAEAHPTRHERLTKTVVEAIEPPAAGHLIVWDEPRVGERRGYGIRVNAGGARTYFAQNRLPGGKEVKVTIGRHGAPWIRPSWWRSGKRPINSRNRTAPFPRS
jgi:hypothetical protein